MLASVCLTDATDDRGKPADQEGCLAIQTERHPEAALWWKNCNDSRRLKRRAFRRPVSHSLITRYDASPFALRERLQPINVCLAKRASIEG